MNDFYQLDQEPECFTENTQELRTMVQQYRKYARQWSESVDEIGADLANLTYSVTKALVPENKLLDAAHLVDLSHPAQFDIGGVYFLLDGREVVYVGKSERGVVRRLLEHWGKREKENWMWDSYSYLEFGKDKIHIAECAYINKFQPRYNKQGIYK